MLEKAKFLIVTGKGQENDIMKKSKANQDKLTYWSTNKITPKHLLLELTMQNGLAPALLTELELIVEYAVLKERAAQGGKNG